MCMLYRVEVIPRGDSCPVFRDFGVSLMMRSLKEQVRVEEESQKEKRGGLKAL